MKIRGRSTAGDQSSVEDYSFRSQPSERTLPVQQSSHSTRISNNVNPEDRVNNSPEEYRRRVSLASADVAMLLTSTLGEQAQQSLAFDTCMGTHGNRFTLLRSRLNDTIYELMLAKAAALDGESLNRIPTNAQVPPLTGDDAIDGFVMDRFARRTAAAQVVGNEEANENRVRGIYEQEQTESSGNWQNSSTWLRGLVVLLIVLFIICLSHLAATIFLFVSNETFEHPYVCKTPNCLVFSNWLQEGIDKTNQPCDDFYRFACGKYESTHASLNNTSEFIKSTVNIPYNYEGNPELGRLLHRIPEYPLNQLLPFYQSCINQPQRDEIGLQPFLNLLVELKLVEPVRSARLDVGKLLARIYKKTNKFLFLDIYTVRENFVVLSIGQIQNEHRERSGEYHVRALRDTFYYLKKPLGIMDDSEIDTIVYLVFEFEAEIVLLMSKGEATLAGYPDKMGAFLQKPKVFHPNYNPRRTGFFQFDTFIGELFDENSEFGNATIFFNYLLSLTQQEDRLYLLFLEDFFNRTPYYTMVRYLQWVLFKIMHSDLTSRAHRIMADLVPWKGFTPTERCFKSLFSKLHLLAFTRYSRELKNIPELKKKITTVIEEISQTLTELSKGLPENMIDSFKDTFATFSFLDMGLGENEEYLRIFYEGLNMNMDTYLENVFQVLELRARNAILRFRNIAPYQKWPTGSFAMDETLVTNLQGARESSPNRFLNIPLGSLQTPYMGNDLPILNYGGFGFWLAAFQLMRPMIDDFLVFHTKEREIAEPESSVFLQKTLEMEILPRLECILEDFEHVASFEKPEFRSDPAAPASRNRNIVFIAAAQLIMETMARLNRSDWPNYQILPGLEKYTSEQLFFLTLARHSCKTISESVRINLKTSGVTGISNQVNTALRNVKEFASSWGCSSRRFMNPPRRCEFFKQKIQEIT